MDPQDKAAYGKTPSPAERRLRVFVVEDDADSRTMLEALLEMLGHDAVAAGSMEEAIELLSQSRYDVLISDIGLPDGNGWDLLRRLGASRPAYTIAMSGYGMGSDLAKSREAGFRHHLIKPMGPDRIDKLLREAAAEAPTT